MMPTYYSLKNNMKTILVTDKEELWEFAKPFVEVVKAKDYLLSDEYNNEKKIRVINVCQNYRYQSIGYYVSLLAEARDQKVIPSVLSIQDLKYLKLSSILVEDILSDIQSSLSKIKSDEFTLSVYFGKNTAKHYDKLAKKLMDIFNVPCFKIKFLKKKVWLIKKIEVVNIKDIPESHYPTLKEAAEDFFNKQRIYFRKKKQYSFDIAMLINENEKTPPSNKTALDKFIKVGQKLDIFVSLVNKSHINSISEYDGLLIRETTSVNNHTYLFSRKAQSEGLTVIDDPVSIFKCSNKVYLAELMRRYNIKSPKSIILNKQNVLKTKIDFPFPLIIKLPDSSFSKGVFKVTCQDELEANLSESFCSSDLIIVQEFMPTDFDWRIGVFNNKPLFACRYYMAKNHWQIYNWDNTEENAGDFDVCPLEEVPKIVISTALKATSHIGDGLYGVDIKHVKDAAYVIEVNDNPNIDAGIEDKLLEDRLYEIILQGFIDKIMRNKKFIRA